jgi:uncharacterized delta-60 repeat protein
MFARISINHNINVIEGGTNEPLSITLDTPAPAGGLVVKYATTGSTTTSKDYSLTAGNNITAVTADTFTIAAGATTANLNVVAAKDIVSNPPYKTFTINLPEVVYFDSSPYSVGVQPSSIAAGDFNGDGISDLVTANVNNGDPIGNVSVILSGNSKTTSSVTNFSVGSSAPSFVTVGDFNGDGKSDLVTGNLFSNDVSVLLGNGKGSFGTPIKSIVGSSPNSIAVSDFNGDGKSDLAVIHAGKQVSIVMGNGDGSFGTPTNFELGVGVLNAASVILGDFNGDGIVDLATANLGTNNISVLLGAGNGGFYNFTNFKVGTFPNSIAVGDLNGDSKADLVTANLDSTISVLLGDGNGSFGSTTNIGVGGLEAKSVKIGDFDGDGKADLATANFSSNNISILPGNGDGSFGAPKTFAVGSGPDSLAVGDFNGDGKVDLATANFNSNSVSVLSHNLPPTISPLKIVPDGYDIGINPDLIIQLESTTDGKILAVGINSSNMTVITRYNSDGSLDKSFGIAGKLNTPLTNTPPILVTPEGEIIIAGNSPDGKSYVFRLLANSQQPDISFANGRYSTGNTNRIDSLNFRINPIDKSNEIIINQSGDRELYYLKTSTLLDANGKIKPLPINNITTATPLSLDENVLNGILSSTTIDRTNAKVQDILNKLGEPLIAEIRSKFSSVQGIGFGAESDGSILVGLSGTKVASSDYLSGAAHFSVDGKLDNSFGANGLTIFPFPTNFKGLADERIDKNDRFCLAIYNPETKDVSVYRYTRNGKLDSTFGTNGKVTLPQSFGDFSTYYGSLRVVFDSQDRLLVVGDSHSSAIDINQKNSLNVVRINTNGIIDNTFGNNGVFQLSPQQTPMNGRDVLIGKNDSLFVGGNIVSKYDIGGLNNTISPTRNDFNGDGNSDILWRNNDGSVAQWQMNGKNVTPSAIGKLTSDWTIAGTGDFNGDSKADILFTNTNGAIATWQMDGSTVAKTSTIGNITSDWKIAGTGDFNGDGKSDILWRNTNGAVAIWAMDGATVKSSTLTSTPTLDASWKTAGTGDFNGDGKSDILWRNDDGSVALWQMNGANITTSTLVSKLSSDWKINGTGDFNGDGKTDILWRNDDDSVVLWQMDGSNITSSSRTSTPSLAQSWKTAGVDDYNGDGKADILWRNDNSLAVWQMNGSMVVSSTLTSVPADSNSWKIAAPIL